MARNPNYDLNYPLMEAGLESPADEDELQDMFNQAIAEGSRIKEEDHVGSLSNNQKSNSTDRGRRDEIQGTSSHYMTADRWSSDTREILAHMPSNTIGHSRGAIFSQFYNRSMKLRRRKQSKPTIQDFSPSGRPSILGYGMETADTVDGDEVEEMRKKDRLVDNLRTLSASDQVKMLREIPLNLTDKCELRRLTREEDKQTDRNQNLSCMQRLHFYIIIAAGHFWYSWLSFLHSLHLWQKPLKRVSGLLGSGVQSYFLFLRKLLFLNVFMAVVMGFFLVLPQAIHPPKQSVKGPTFSGLELLTGAGYFSKTVMYYGYYSNDILKETCQDKVEIPKVSILNKPNTNCTSGYLFYNMSLAYFFTIGFAFFITCIILVYSMSKSFGQSFILDKSQNSLAMKVFCSWDFKVTKVDSIRLMSGNICTQLRELLGEMNQGHVTRTLRQKLSKLMTRSLAWSICIGSIAAAVVGISYFSDFMHKNLKHTRSTSENRLLMEARLLALPILVSVINLLLPGLFNLAAWMEDYQSPTKRTYVALSRNLLLKVSVLGFLGYHWLVRVAGEYTTIGLQCWETFVGEELYRFLVVDFIFALLYSIFGELLWKIFSMKVLKRTRKPEFDIAKNVLDLIYGQTLAWLGVLFSPILPLVQILKLILLFYIKLCSVMTNCQCPQRPYRVSQMTTILITLLCFPSFLGASVCVTYTMWSVKPSLECGPFRGLDVMIQAGKQWMKEVEGDNPQTLSWLHSHLVEHPFSVFVLSGIFLVVIYFHSQVVDGQRKIIHLLQEQIKFEGKDKVFLITQLQKLHERKQRRAKKCFRQESAC